MSSSHYPTEKRPLETVLELLPERVEWLPVILERIRRFAPLPQTGRALDIGAAQGLSVLALRRAGWEAVGVEPEEEAIAVAAQLAEHEGVEVEIVKGVAEALPFPDDSFDLVLAEAVLEHVDDPEAAFREVGRVLRSGGLFYFLTTNALCPHQYEIARFPLFPWYPPPVRRAIMRWAAKKRPSLVRYTETPALNWFTPWSVRRSLARAGFGRVYDDWDFKRSGRGWRGRLIRLIAAKYALRLLGDIFIPSPTYVAVK